LAARDNTIYGYDGLKLKQKYNRVKQQFLEHPNITAATTSRFLLGGWFTKGQFESEDSGKQTFSLCPVDEDFIPFFKIPLIRGSNFSPSHAALSFDQRDTLNRPEQFIVNQAAAVQLGLKDPVGKPLNWHNGRSGGTIIGVLKDFHFETLKNTLDPVVLITQQQRLKFLFLALFLSSLGLFGLALFIMTQRTKEIGIRKVLGASIQSILILFAKEHLTLIIIANLIALPSAYYTMSLWLQNFAYRITLHPTYFILAALIALGIFFTTLIYQAICVSLTNPVDALRNE
jgi:putative ABC transport system permease protein